MNENLGYELFLVNIYQYHLIFIRFMKHGASDWSKNFFDTCINENFKNVFIILHTNTTTKSDLKFLYKFISSLRRLILI